MKLPNDYIEYLRNGGEAEFETDHEFGGYIVLEPIEGIEKYNEDIEIKDFAPGFLAFASDGGGEAFVFDESGRIYLMPLVGMGPDEAIQISESWTEYERRKLASSAESVVHQRLGGWGEISKSMTHSDFQSFERLEPAGFFGGQIHLPVQALDHAAGIALPGRLTAPACYRIFCGSKAKNPGGSRGAGPPCHRGRELAENVNRHTVITHRFCGRPEN